MLRSTSKQVKDKIQGWLIELAKEGLQGYLPQKDYDGQVTEHEIENTPMTAVNRMFEIEKAWQIKQEGRQNAFNDWQRGLCSCLPAYKSLVYYDAIRAKVQEWLEQTDAESARYEDEECDDYFLWLIFREFECIIKKEQKFAAKK
jgi:hypothetical protein